MTRRLFTTLALAGLTACGGSRILHPLVPTPEGAVPHAPPATSVAAAEIPWPTVATRVLANGLTVIVSERPRDHEVSIRCRIVGAGESLSDAKSGVPTLVAMMLRRGVRLEGDEDLSWPSGPIVAGAFYSVGTNYSEISYTLAPDALDAAFDALYLEESRPAFDPEWFELERSQQLGSIGAYEASPIDQAAALLATAAFGRDSPSGRSPYGLRGVVAATEVDDVIAFHAAHYAPNRAVVVVAGPITADAVFATAERAFGAWTRSVPATPRYVPTLESGGPRELYVDLPSDHAQLLFAIPYHIDSDDDLVAYGILSDLYGGVFDSWLNLALREDDGSLYGASASPLGAERVGLLVTAVSIAFEDVESVVSRLDAVTERLSAGRVDADELPLVHRQRTAGYIDAFANASSATRTIVNGHMSFGDVARLRAQHERGLAMTTDELAAAAGRIFDPSRIRLLALGPRARLAPAIARARAH